MSKQSWKEFIHSGKPTAGKMLQLPPVRHAVTYRNISVHPFLCKLRRLPKVKGTKTVALIAVTDLAISNLTRKIAKRAAAALKEMSG